VRFHEVGNGIAMGLRPRGEHYPTTSSTHSPLSLSHDPTKTQLHRTRGDAKSRGDTDSHGPSVSLYTHPLSILFDFIRVHAPALLAFVSRLDLHK
jgi:hypothetical protein